MRLLVVNAGSSSLKLAVLDDDGRVAASRTLERWQGEAPVLLPETVRDRDEDHPPVPRRAEIEATNRRTLESLRRQALPLIRGYGLGF